VWRSALLPYHPMRVASLRQTVRHILYLKGPGRAHAKIQYLKYPCRANINFQYQSATPLRVVIAFASLPTTLLSTPAPAPRLTHPDIRLSYQADDQRLTVEVAKVGKSKSKLATIRL
jgi:hypothetical protein